MNTESKCNCEHCGGHIAFPSEAAGQTVECPHCGQETSLFLPDPPSQAKLADPGTPIYLQIQEEKRGPYAKSQIQSMWNNGLITLDTLYWHDGMDDWGEISDLVGKLENMASTPKATAPVADIQKNLMALAKAAADAANPSEAYNYYTRVLEVEPTNCEAWAGKAEAAGWMSTLHDVKTVDMVAAFNNAINCAQEPEKDNIRLHAADVINRVTSTVFGMAKKHLLQFAKVNTVWPEYVQQCRLLLAALEVGYLYDPNNKTTVENIIHISKDNIQGHSYSPDGIGFLSKKFSVTPQYEALLRAKIDEYAVKMYYLDPGFVKPRL